MAGRVQTETEQRSEQAHRRRRQAWEWVGRMCADYLRPLRNGLEHVEAVHSRCSLNGRAIVEHKLRQDRHHDNNDTNRITVSE